MSDTPYDPFAWFWQIGDDDSRYWSSAAGAYIETLPGGAGLTRIASEAELSDVLRPHGLRVPLASNEDVNAERDRRIATGASFPVDGVGDVALTGRDFDMIVLSQKRVEASVKKNAGSTAADVLFRDAGNTNRMFTPDQMISLVDQGQAWVQAVMEVSWAMKDGTGEFSDGIPADFADDKWWPAA